MRKILFTFIISLFSLTALAQDNTQELKTEDKKEHSHGKNTFGMSNGVVSFIGDDHLAYGLHFHYLRQISDSKFSIGASYSRIFGEHTHNGAGVVFAYNPFSRFNVAISPGVVFEGAETHEESHIDTHDEHEEGSRAKFGLHFEMSYDWEIRGVHIGPAIEYGLDTDESHFSLGLHLGYNF